MPLSKDERIELVLIVGDGYVSSREAADIFKQRHPDRSVDQKTICRLMNKFKETGNVADASRSGRPRSSTDEEKSILTLAVFERSPIKSQGKAAAEVGISRRSVGRILKENKYHPYKIQLHQGLCEEDGAVRFEFCSEMIEMVENGNIDFADIAFGDEAMFYLNGHVNRHNCRYYSDSNPHWMEDSKVQNDPRVMVWCGILGDSIIGPFFFNDSVNMHSYLHMLKHNILPSIVALQDKQTVWFMHDGAPAHYSRIVRNYLDAEFPNHWIGRAGPIPWPSRSPDLTPIDFFLWGHIKSIAYNARPRTIDELKANIAEAIKGITPGMLQNVRRAFSTRLRHCIAAEGKHFEYLI